MRQNAPLRVARHHARIIVMTMALAFLFLAMPAFAQQNQRQGAYIAEIQDEDGDKVIQMETDWMSMLLMPDIGATVTKFTFRPTQNEILELVQPKNLKQGGGLLQDNVWEQDWRYQELRGKYYNYQITQRGPDQVQVVFETTLDGWLGGKDSGLKSKLLENLKIRRTVTLQQGTPYFLFDVEFINDAGNAKLPLYWCHNSARINVGQLDHMIRPSDLGLNEEPGKLGTDYVYNFNRGWSAHISPQRKEGVVYLMDYDYLSFLYNNGPNTSEWIYDNLLVLKGKPLKTRIYVIPTMGLSAVADAHEYAITQLDPVREKDQFRLRYKLAGSYKKVRKITLVPEIEYDLLAAEHQKATLAPIELKGLGIEPVIGESAFAGQSSDPTKIHTTMFIELPDGSQVQKTFDYFYVGDYALGANMLKDLKTPVALLDRPRQNPDIPVPAADLKINRKDFNVFALLGNHSRLLGYEAAINSIPGVKVETGYHPGFLCGTSGLTDFPYDFDRLFNYRVMVFHNSVFDVTRFVGMQVLSNWIDRGGGIVYTGGDNCFGLEKENFDHPIYKILPFEPHSIIVKAAAQLNSPVKDHPIFTGIDLSHLPWQYYIQKVKSKSSAGAAPKVLMKVGDDPFIVETTVGGDQRTIVILAVPFGDSADFPGKTAIEDWDQWKQLLANIVQYAGHGL
ncbi:MAG TPA: hypothetical protein VG326_18900 [Tepidisphaeraceae bacterium]|jgi:hypothetical protein|nr:hypothetical protein [Tepidisphaeraceae bacterium]